MVEYRIELIFVPVADLDRSREFYGTTLGWPIDHDREVHADLHFIQVTPPGSACSICFGRGIGEMEPGTLKALQVVVTDIEAAHRDLRDRGVEISDVDDQPWGRFVHFADPDGNTCAVQEIVIPAA